MLSNLQITLLLLTIGYGYTLQKPGRNATRGDAEALTSRQYEGATVNNSQLEAETKNGDKLSEMPLPEMSPERRNAYKSIRDRRVYFKRREEAVRHRKTQSRRVDPDRDVLEPQETVHRPQHTLPKQSVINVDRRFYEFGVKLPKRISTKLSLVDGWGTTSLPSDMDNLVMPPATHIQSKMSRLVSSASTGRSIPAPLPLSMPPDTTFPTIIEIDNENNKRLLSEMNKEMLLTTTTTTTTTTQNPLNQVTNKTTSVSTPLTIVNQSSSATRSMTANTNNTTATTQLPMTTTELKAIIKEQTTSLPENASTVSIETLDNSLFNNNSNGTTEAHSTASSSFTKAGPISEALPPTTRHPIVYSTTPEPRIIVNRPNTNATQGRAFPTGFNDFHREDEPEEIPEIKLEPKHFNNTRVPLSTVTPESTNEVISTSPISIVTTAKVDPPKVSDSDSSGSYSVVVSDFTIEPEHNLTSADVLPVSTEAASRPPSPPYVKVYVTSSPTEDSPLDIFYNSVNDSDAGIVVSIVDESNVSPQSVGIAVYLLAVFGLVPLILALVFVAKFFLNRQRKSECGSDASSTDAQPPSSRPRGSELRKSPSSATTITLVHATRLPRVQQKLPNWELPRHQLSLLSILGTGNFGQVWKAELQEGNTRLVAVKTVKEGATEKEQEEIIKELQIMQQIGHHPNVVQLLGCCTEKDPYYLVMEYIPNGKLLTFLRDHRTQGNYYNFSNDGEALTSRDLTVFMYCVARGMEYLSSKRIIHRDLAARNVLVDQHKMCKIADFGMSRLAQEGTDGEVYEERQQRGALPIRWMAPESLHYSVFTFKSDVWSFGILMWEIVTLGSTPYPSLGAREVVQGVRTGLRLQRPSHVKSDLFRLISRCWAQDPLARPSFTELRLHLADLLDGSCVDLDSYALDNRFQLQTRTRNRRSRNNGKGTVTLVGNGSFTVNSRILENQFSIV